jgi:hypothetical protein
MHFLLFRSLVSVPLRFLISHKCKVKHVELISNQEPHLAYRGMEPVEELQGGNGYRHAPPILFPVKQSLLPHRTSPRGVLAERNHKKKNKKLNLSLLQTMDAHRVVRLRGSHIF